MSRRVLIVDDNEDVRRILGLRLKNGGFDVGGAADGAEALEQLRRSNWDVVLLDLVMPGADGFVFLEGLEGAAHPPILVVTQCDDADSRERVLALGAARCVSKVAAFERGFVGELSKWLAEIELPRPGA